MKRFSFIKQAAFCAGASLSSASTLSAPGILEDLPLNISTSVQPNILFLLDDSGSMDWEQLISQTAQDAYSVGANGRATDLAFPPTNDTELNELCLQYNLMAYNPNVDYEPWSNTDNAANIYGDKTLVTALDNPYISTSLRNISDHVYTSWVDDGDTVFEVGECGTYASISTDLTPGAFASYNIGTTSSSSTEAAGYLLDSGGESGTYLNDQNETFLIQPTGATQITLQFNVFDIENFFDNLNIYSGTSNADPLVASYTGDTVPADLIVNSGSVFVEFISDFSVVDTGFIIFWNHSTSGVTTPTAAASVIDPDACRADANCTVVADLPTNATAAAGVINTQENYANWYTYYRKREYVAKKALSDIIDESTSRLGLATLHNRGNAGTLIEDMRNDSNKQALFTNLYNGFSQGGTPLRQNLEQVGQYFQEGVASPDSLFGFTPDHSGDGTVSNDSPIFSSSNGGVCQQNFTVVFSDGFWNGGAPSVGDQDSNTAGNNYDGGWFADTYLSGNPAALNNTLADVAMNYLKNDLSITLTNSANVRDVRDTSQTIPHQHLTTYTVAFGLDGDLLVNPTDASFPGWNDPINNGGQERIDDMRHAAWNGRGEFLSANDPQSLISTLTSAINDIDDRVGTAAAASFNSGSISSDTLVFQSIFSTEDWSGNLFAYRFDDGGVIDSNSDGIVNQSDALWSASDQLASQVSGTGYSNRNVITYNGTQGVEFEFPNPYTSLSSTTLSSDQVTDLLTNAPDPSIVSTQAYGNHIVNYLRGDNDNEVGSGATSLNLFRPRSGNYLGSFIHSSPQYMGAPVDNYPNLIEGASNPYNSFRLAQQNRDPLVYVGGNDGMLHAFDASTSGGDEVFAYIPSFMVNNLHTLAETDYSHLAYVDATPTVRDVFVNGAWRTYLVGGARSGGRGIYVLDVTNPATLANPANASNIVEFEFLGDPSLNVTGNANAGGDADLGFTYSRPQIAKMNDGSWVAIVANGYNAEGDGRAKLFIIDLETGAARKIDTGEGSIVGGDCNDPASDCNGLSSPAIVDLNSDSRVDRIYAGDLHGNLWVFNVQDSSPSNWGVAFNGNPLFRACSTSSCASNNRQPITTKPTVTSHPGRKSSSTSPNLLVYFGTGQFIAENDESDDSLQSFYGVWDAGSSDSTSSYGNLDKGDLQEQSFSNTSGVIGVSNEVVDYLVTGEFGWYVDLSVPAPNVFLGGRVVINPIVIDRVVFFIVTIPSGEICNRDGDSYLVALDRYDGSEVDFNIFDTDGDGVPDSSAPATNLGEPAVGLDSISSGGGDNLVITGADGSIVIDSIAGGRTIPQGRKSWSILK